jgi:triosephosphate isomerase
LKEKSYRASPRCPIEIRDLHGSHPAPFRNALRSRLIVGNWKMHKTATEAVDFVRRLFELIHRPAVEVVLAPPFPALQAVKKAIAARPFGLAAQNLYWEDEGAFTGEVSGPMLKDVGCSYVIIGHSERRQQFGEDDAAINKKLLAGLRHGLKPILCLGESLPDRESGRTDTVVTEQLRKALYGLSQQQVALLTLAYEPIWAIGTGRAASPDQAEAVHRLLRQVLTDGWKIEKTVRILYGGSVTPENAAGFFASLQVDGALVGGACLDPERFATIVALGSTKQE